MNSLKYNTDNVHFIIVEDLKWTEMSLGFHHAGCHFQTFHKANPFIDFIVGETIF